MVPHPHSQPCTAAAANGRHPQQHALGNPPPRPFRLPLVNAVKEKRDHIDDEEVKDEEGGDGKILHGLNVPEKKLSIFYSRNVNRDLY